MNKWILVFIVGIFLGSFVSDAINLPVVANDNLATNPSETRYMSGEEQSVNELTAYKLEAVPPSNPNMSREVVQGWRFGGYSVWWGMRVWRLLSNGSEIEITSGIPVAVVHRPDSGDGPGLQNATWDCPQVELSGNDSIVVRVYAFGGGDSWESAANYTTQQLGAAQLEAATWRVYYLTRRYTEQHMEPGPPPYYIPTYVDFTYGGFSWGSGSSRIENFEYSETPVPEYSLVVTISLLLLVTLMALTIRKKSIACALQKIKKDAEASLGVARTSHLQHIQDTISRVLPFPT
jgi:hypothetical protein